MNAIITSRQVGLRNRYHCLALVLFLLVSMSSQAALRSWVLPAEQDICHLYHLRTQASDLLVAPAGSHVYVYTYQNQSWTNSAVLNTPYGNVSTVIWAQGSSNRFVSCLSTGETSRYVGFHDLVKNGSNWSWLEVGQAPLPTNTTQYIYLRAATEDEALIMRNSDDHLYLVRMGATPVDLGAHPSDTCSWTPFGWLLCETSLQGQQTIYDLQLRAFGSGSVITSSTYQTIWPEGAMVVSTDGIWLVNDETGRITRLALPALQPDRTIQASTNPVYSSLLADDTGTVWVALSDCNPADGVYRLTCYDAANQIVYSQETAYPTLSRLAESGRFILDQDEDGVLYDSHTGAIMTRRTFGVSGPAVDRLVIQTPDGADFAVKACFWWDGLEIKECDPVQGPWQDTQRIQTVPTNRILDFGSIAVGTSNTLVIYVTNTLESSWAVYAVPGALPATACSPFSISGSRYIYVPTNGAEIAVIYNPTNSGIHYASLRLEKKNTGTFDEFLLMGRTIDAAKSDYSPIRITDAWVDTTGSVHIACTSDSEALTAYHLLTSTTLFDAPNVTTSQPVRTSHFVRDFTSSDTNNTLFFRITGTDSP